MRTVIVDPPSYVTDELGRRPTDSLQRQRAWDRGARTIESYRQHHGATIDPTEPGLGTRPHDPATRNAHRTASRRLEAAHVELGRTPAIDLGIGRGPDL